MNKENNMILYGIDELKNVIFKCDTRPIWEHRSTSNVYVTDESNGFFVYEDSKFIDDPFRGKVSYMKLISISSDRNEAIITAYEYGKKRLKEFYDNNPK